MEARKMHVHQGLMPMSEANSHGQLDSASRGKDTKDSQSDTTLASQQGNGGELESSLTPDSQVNQDPTHDSSGKTLANSSTTQQYLQNNYRSSENASASSAPPTFTAWCQANGLAPLDASSTDPAAATKVST